ncbi:MAG: uroporphyrinogen-III synthase [Oricola sp.]
MSGPAKPVVWITRPRPGADRTADAVAAMGFEPLVLPLTEVRACDPDIDMEDAERAGFVAVTSSNAIRLAPKLLLEVLKDKPVYAVGDATRDEAKARGLALAESAGGAVDDLVSLVAGREKRGAHGLYLCGRRRTGDLEGKLAERGISCLPAEVYGTYSVSHLTHETEAAPTSRSPDAILFHSALSAHAFADLVGESDPQAFANTRFFVLSERIAEALPGWARARAAVAAAPDEDNLLAALRTAFAL